MTRGLSEGIFTGSVLAAQAIWDGLMQSHNASHEEARREMERARHVRD